ncbi:quinone-oxidoreductase homolog, chloroplastic-like [Spinacia oleracea]|uniref:Quinone-oxidoreductase homolog, chloroplastic-like n=1 Tax=Spinacia oleracea TaxID=3562 RepID=A0A9R0JBF3_SPIOL|nr:quinone-oxidoreductase homolog, chloroplastic-like [Spinacia oleracea]XP_021863928.1 quinone-oxidoreductase homolog, chloroplastic-like [Spinacia oleracea]XP_056684355.1 quinone-oxidoreductase homolog, chloroplastic-like [Spinacia oleracea]XP_056684356.1 quinone-oxidoreductase homolog, chloroplastic-like [Spinacia oleracea]XP_056687527.1 quinone-oxidoreductase homolog, chloroplastic-like [Spinacia oleracea]XP_056687528.1 quinone-oxidoreductase homolog, chloroplastic-like [Spinacia oleracea]
MVAKLMNAIRYSRYGGGTTALKRVKIDVPDPKADEVLLKVEVVSLNAFDWKIQKGVSRPILPRKFPYVPVLFRLSVSKL